MNNNFFINLFEASIVLAIATGILYISGYSYFESYYAQFGLKIGTIKLDTEQVLTWGAPVMLFFIMGVGLIFMLSPIVSLVKTYIDSEDKKEKDDSDLKSYFRGVLLLISIFIFAIILSVQSKSGIDNAYRHITEKAPIVKLNLTKDSELDYSCEKLGFITGNGESYFFFKIEDIPSIPTKTIIVPASVVESIEYTGYVGIQKSPNK